MLLSLVLGLYVNMSYARMDPSGPGNHAAENVCVLYVGLFRWTTFCIRCNYPEVYFIPFQLSSGSVWVRYFFLGN